MGNDTFTTVMATILGCLAVFNIAQGHLLVGGGLGAIAAWMYLDRREKR